MATLICGHCLKRTTPVLQTAETRDRFDDDRESVYVSSCCESSELFTLHRATLKDITEALS